jgi:hypothetical protein
MNGNLWNDFARKNINKGFYDMTIEILAFVWAHYYFSTRNDTAFWQDIRKMKISDLPKEAQDILNAFLPNPLPYIFLSPTSMFSTFQWFTMMHAGGAYKNATSNLTLRQKEYSKYFLDGHSARVDLAKKLFPNQYDYLKTWYRDWQSEEL